jgi:flavin reductase (DIM6/NTAB) family NADH-FMN oxidoreductase RutF
MSGNAVQQVADDPLVPVSIRDNFYQSSAFFPMPFALITTKNEAGVTSIGPYSLVFPLDISEEHSMLLVSRASSNTATNLRRNGKCALHWIEFDKPLLQTVVDLGYPGVPPEEKMRDVPFELMPSPTPQFRDDPDFPLLIKGAFQIFECELDGRFEYHPVRRAPRQLVEDYLALKVKNILMPESFRTKLLERQVFPDMPISYGFRGGKEFWFVRHGEPFHLPVPKGKGMGLPGIYRMANSLDSEVEFTGDACELLTAVPRPFVESALKVFVEMAKEGKVSKVDAEFINSTRTRWSTRRDP